MEIQRTINKGEKKRSESTVPLLDTPGPRPVDAEPSRIVADLVVHVLIFFPDSIYKVKQTRNVFNAPGYRGHRTPRVDVGPFVCP